MGDIYRNAGCGILWLGVDDNPELALTLRNAARYGSLVNKMRRWFRKVKKEDESSKAYPAYWTAPILCKRSPPFPFVSFQSADEEE
jgi:hypothetical protein